MDCFGLDWIGLDGDLRWMCEGVMPKSMAAAAYLLFSRLIAPEDRRSHYR